MLESCEELSGVTTKPTTRDCHSFEVGPRHQYFLQAPSLIPAYLWLKNYRHNQVISSQGMMSELLDHIGFSSKPYQHCPYLQQE